MPSRAGAEVCQAQEAESAAAVVASYVVGVAFLGVLLAAKGATLPIRCELCSELARRRQAQLIA